MAKILVIDDYEPDRKLLGVYAEAEGHEVIECADANDALGCIEQYQPDMIFLDIIMPGKEGVETLTEVKQKYPSIPIIVMTGLDPTYIDIALGVGADEGLPKRLISSRALKLIDKYSGRDAHREN
jgi:CheY-like chemotaxis protein